jgi:hypothetical protein
MLHQGAGLYGSDAVFLETVKIASETGAFLAHALEAFPFSVCAIQTDNGSGLAHPFKAACETAGIPHLPQLPPLPDVRRARHQDCGGCILLVQRDTDRVRRARRRAERLRSRI